MSFDLLRYREHKELGLIKVEKQNDQVKLICKQYDRFTGEELDPVTVIVTPEIIKQGEDQCSLAKRVREECETFLQDVRSM